MEQTAEREQVMAEQAEQLSCEQQRNQDPRDRTKEAIAKLAAVVAGVKAEFGEVEFVAAVASEKMPSMIVVGDGGSLKDAYLLSMRATEYLKSAYMSECEHAAQAAVGGDDE